MNETYTVNVQKADDPRKLYETYYRFGIRPTWLQINRVLNKQVRLIFLMCQY